MKRLAGLWGKVVDWDNLYRAYRLARRGKKKRDDVARFGLNWEMELSRLRDELQTGAYRPGEYRQFTIYERKPRLISAAPFRDRVVHHAVMNQIEKPLDRRFIDDSFACRKGKGVHAAVARYQTFANRYAYVLKLDIQRYFPSIDHSLLKATLRRRIKDNWLLELLDLIIDHGPIPDEAQFCPYFPGDDLFSPLERRRGIPIGNLTSQFFANLYLDDLDHWLKEQRQVSGYVRYVDDLFLFGDDKTRLWALRDEVARQLSELRLRLHDRKRQIYRTTDWVDVLGYVVKPTQRRLRGENARRFSCRLRGMARAYAENRIDLDAVHASIQAWIGHAQHADTWLLREQVLSKVKFTRGTSPEGCPRGARRLVEQQP